MVHREQEFVWNVAEMIIAAKTRLARGRVVFAKMIAAVQTTVTATMAIVWSA
jgi:hypothetical protein